jgi:hypothetical protein
MMGKGKLPDLAQKQKEQGASQTYRKQYVDDQGSSKRVGVQIHEVEGIDKDRNANAG